MRWIPGLAMALLLASGCSDPTKSVLDEVTPGTGGLSGVVVTAAIAPLSGVTVLLEPGGHATVTGEDGLFAFADIATGAYTLSAVRDGYLRTSLGVEVGEGTPAGSVKVVLEADTATARFVESYVFDGFVDWSFNVAGARSTNSASPNYTIGLRAPDFIQSELVWESTQAFGRSLDLTAIANDGNVTVPSIGESVGPSPLLLTLNSSVIQGAKLGPKVLLDFTVFAGEEPVAADTGGGLAVNQGYRLVTHMFYGFLPPEGWRFSSDGEAPSPT